MTTNDSHLDLVYLVNLFSVFETRIVWNGMASVFNCKMWEKIIYWIKF